MSAHSPQQLVRGDTQSAQGALWRRLAWPERKRLLGFALSLALGVGALFGVAHLLASVSATISAQGRERLGGELALTSWRSFEGDAWVDQARAQLSAEGELIEGVELASMVSLKDSPPSLASPLLVSLRGVMSAYPLRGELAWRVAPRSPELQRGEVWVARSLAAKLSAPASQAQAPQAQDAQTHPHSAIGQTIKIGGEPFKVVGVLEREPDGGVSGALSFAPRVMMRLDDLKALPLIQYGSRVKRTLQWAAPQGLDKAAREALIKRLSDTLREGAPEHIEVSDALSSQPNLLTIFERVALFFSMIGLVTLSLSTLSFASGLLGLLRDHLPLIGALRSLGVSGEALSAFYTRLTLLVGLMGGLFGVCLGLGLHLGLAHLAAPWLGVTLELSLEPSQALAALALSLLISLLVNTGAQRALSRASAQGLWRAHEPQLKLTRLELSLTLTLTALTLWGYLTWLSGSVFLGGLFVLTLAALALVASLLIALSLKLLAWWRSRLRARSAPALRFALGHALGYRGRVWGALLSLSVGFSLIAALQGTQGSLESAMTLQDERAPQAFMVDIQEDQLAPLTALAEVEGAARLEALPLTRVRLAALKGERVERAALEGESVAAKMRARTLTREHNVTTRVELGEAERVVEGRWWSEEEAKQSERLYVSLEERFAGRLGLGVGDTLTFDVQGVELELEVLSLRRVDWLSLRPNFLLVTHPGALEGAPRTFLASAKLSGDEALARLSASAVERAPNVSVIDMRPIFAEGRRVLGALSAALKLTGGLCALAGALLLILGVRRDHERRASAARALSSLGLSRAQAWRWVSLELTLLGALSTLIVALCSLTLIWLTTRALQLPFSPDPLRLALWLGVSGGLAPLVGFAQAQAQAKRTK